MDKENLSRANALASLAEQSDKSYEFWQQQIPDIIRNSGAPLRMTELFSKEEWLYVSVETREKIKDLVLSDIAAQRYVYQKQFDEF